jgi:RES domain
MAKALAGAPIVIELAAHTPLWRVSRDATGIAFSDAVRRSNRFSPLLDPSGAVIPAWYGGSTDEGAIFESVFHDIRPAQRQRRVYPNQYADRILVEVRTVRVLRLVDLTTIGLHAIGRSRARLIDSLPKAFAATRADAVLLRAAMPEADGFIWVSRANDATRSVVLYQDAGRAPMITTGPAIPLPLGTGPGLELLRRLATAARITVVRP